MRASALNRKQAIAGDVEDSTELYLDEISRVPLLTPARELELAQQIAQCDEDALRTLVVSNLRLVVHVARVYRNEELSLLDLIQEGNLGLLRAARKFDHRLGYRFSSYAIWWIRQAISRAIRYKGHAIRVPVYAANGVARLRRAAWDAEREDDQPPASMPRRQPHQPSAKIIELASRVQPPLSLDRCVDGMVLADTLMDETAESPPEAAERCQLRHQLHKLLEQLPDRQRTIIELRFGLRDGRRRTLREVSANLGLTRERIRQLEAIALAQLRRASVDTDLHSYLE